MPTLHLVARAPDDGAALRNCLRAAAPGDTLLLIGNGVYGAVDERLARRAGATAIAWCALAADVASRGLAGRLRDGVSAVDDDAFVALVVSHQPIVSWS